MNYLSRLMLLTCVLICSCASPKERPTAPPQTAAAKSINSPFDLTNFLPEGVTIESATPTQINQAVLAALRANPKAAAEIAADSFRQVFTSGRYELPGGIDSKQSVDPEPKWTLFGWLFKKRHPNPKPTTAAMSSKALADMEFEQVGN